MRAGTVLKTRHAEGSAGRVQGRELFLEALDGGCFEGRPSSDEDLTKLGALLELTVDAADADPETRPPDKLPSLPRTFEGPALWRGGARVRPTDATRLGPV